MIGKGTQKIWSICFRPYEILLMPYERHLSALTNLLMGANAPNPVHPLPHRKGCKRCKGQAPLNPCPGRAQSAKPGSISLEKDTGFYLVANTFCGFFHCTERGRILTAQVRSIGLHKAVCRKPSLGRKGHPKGDG